VDVVFNPLAVVPAESDVIPKADDGSKKRKRVPKTRLRSLSMVNHGWPRVPHCLWWWYRCHSTTRKFILAPQNTIKSTRKAFKSHRINNVGVGWCVAHVPRIACSGHFSTMILNVNDHNRRVHGYFLTSNDAFWRLLPLQGREVKFWYGATHKGNSFEDARPSRRKPPIA
jgi:hypothetical protein